MINNYLNILEKSAINGVITGLASGVTTGLKYKVPMPFTNRVMPLYVFCAGAGIVASIVSDAVHYVVKNEINISKKGADENSLYLGAIAGAVAYWGIVGIANRYLQQDMGSTTLLLTGAVAEVSSSIGYNFIKG